MKKEYTCPTADVKNLDSIDVIATSGSSTPHGSPHGLGYNFYNVDKDFMTMSEEDSKNITMKG